MFDDTGVSHGDQSDDSRCPGIISWMIAFYNTAQRE